MVAMTKVPSAGVLALHFTSPTLPPHHCGKQQHRGLKQCRPCDLSPTNLSPPASSSGQTGHPGGGGSCHCYWSAPPFTGNLSIVVFHWMFSGNWVPTTEPRRDIKQVKLPEERMSWKRKLRIPHHPRSKPRHRLAGSYGRLQPANLLEVVLTPVSSLHRGERKSVGGTHPHLPSLSLTPPLIGAFGMSIYVLKPKTTRNTPVVKHLGFVSHETWRMYTTEKHGAS